MNFAKIIGLIAIAASLVMLSNVIEGKAASGVLAFNAIFGFDHHTSLVMSITITLIGLFMGFRALIWNKVCIGDQCRLESES